MKFWKYLSLAGYLVFLVVAVFLLQWEAERLYASANFLQTCMRHHDHAGTCWSATRALVHHVRYEGSNFNFGAWAALLFGIFVLLMAIFINHAFSVAQPLPTVDTTKTMQLVLAHLRGEQVDLRAIDVSGPFAAIMERAMSPAFVKATSGKRLARGPRNQFGA